MITVPILSRPKWIFRLGIIIKLSPDKPAPFKPYESKKLLASSSSIMQPFSETIYPTQKPFKFMCSLRKIDNSHRIKTDDTFYTKMCIINISKSNDEFFTIFETLTVPSWFPFKHIFISFLSLFTTPLIASTTSLFTIFSYHILLPSSMKKSCYKC